MEKKKKKKQKPTVIPIKKGDPNKVVEASQAKTINTAIEAVKEYAVQLKGRAEDGKVRGILVIEFGIDPKDNATRQAGAVSSAEAALGALIIQQIVVGGAKKEEG